MKKLRVFLVGFLTVALTMLSVSYGFAADKTKPKITGFTVTPGTTTNINEKIKTSFKINESSKVVVSVYNKSNKKLVTTLSKDSKARKAGTYSATYTGKKIIGNYYIQVNATDAAGNKGSATKDFSITKTIAQLDITSFKAGSYVDSSGDGVDFSYVTNKPVKATISIVDSNNSKVVDLNFDDSYDSTYKNRGTLNWNGNDLNDDLVPDDEYKYTVTVIDADKQKLTVTGKIIVDTNAPQILDVEDGNTYSNEVTPTSEDTDIKKVVLIKDDVVINNYELGDKITDGGSYTLKLIDECNNVSEMSFEIADNIGPVIDGVEDGNTYNSVTPISSDTDIESIDLTKDGESVDNYRLGKAITVNGDYILIVTDKSGNETSVSFTIDNNSTNTPPDTTIDPGTDPNADNPDITDPAI